MGYAMVSENGKVNTPKGILELGPILFGLGYPRLLEECHFFFQRNYEKFAEGNLGGVLSGIPKRIWMGPYINLLEFFKDTREVYWEKQEGEM